MRLLELTLSSTDLDVLRQFYCAFLGFREIIPVQTGRLGLQVGDTYLFFDLVEPNRFGRYHFALDVPSDRFEASIKWLKERRALLSDLNGKSRFHSDSWNADMVYFTDPLGNILELIARNEKALPDRAGLSTQPDRPFNASEIIAVSEIGLAVDDVTGSVAALKTRMPGVELYSGIDDDSFAAVGNLDGLMIVVRRGRIWYPNSGVPAEFLPLDVLLEVQTGQRYRLTAPPFPFIISPAR
jgi:catechol-2,3-dioxygenase